MEHILCLDIDDQANQLTGRRGNRMEPDIIGNGPLVQGCVLTADPVDLGAGAGFIRVHRYFANRRLAFDVLFRNFFDVHTLVFLQAGLHDPRQDDPLGKQALARGVIAGVQIGKADIFRYRCLKLQKTPLLFDCILAWLFGNFHLKF